MPATVMPTGYRICCDSSDSGSVAISNGLMDNWTSAGSELSYGVMWQRDTLGKCYDEDGGSITITDGSTS